MTDHHIKERCVLSYCTLCFTEASPHRDRESFMYSFNKYYYDANVRRHESLIILLLSWVYP